ncbi:MAG: hypothetical protein QNK23_11845 [Crocinitomicaceae bacterium]|nr:hypothetical protein [Crocinitomicaceae bacterium]
MLRLLLISTLLVGALASCMKKGEKNEFKWACSEATCEECISDIYENPYTVPSDVEVYYVEPLVYDAKCGCITGGWVKYLKNGKTVAMVKYGEGECDRQGIKVMCVDGDCDLGTGSQTCTFQTDCSIEP